nr:putative ribonuclease H-like domain-containing protein [Tanacetum cinerariifolium]
MMIDGLDMNNETVAKYLQKYEEFAAELSIGERIELINDLVKFQDNYEKVLKHQMTPKECHMHAVKRIFRYLKGHLKLGLWYLKESLFDLVTYSDSDYGGATQDRKSTTEGCRRRLISWQCKKQTIMATSTIEAEYVAVASCCGQVLWI